MPDRERRRASRKHRQSNRQWRDLAAGGARLALLVVGAFAFVHGEYATAVTALTALMGSGLEVRR